MPEPVEITGDELKRVATILKDRFNYATLKEFLFFEFGLDIEDIILGESMTEVVLELLAKAKRDKFLDVLLEKLAQKFPEVESITSREKAGPVPATSSRIQAPTPFFTGRNGVLEQLRTTLESHGRAVLSGLPGVGKTQTVREYARQYRERYSHRFWAKADTREQLLFDLASAARELDLPLKNQPELEAVVRLSGAGRDRRRNLHRGSESLGGQLGRRGRQAPRFRRSRGDRGPLLADPP